MPARPRKDIIDESEPGFYHCYSRCVRRAFLCGKDRYSGVDYDHRKAWIEERMRFLAGEMAVEVNGYALMDNHFHMVLRNRPDLVARWSDEEVARRWLTVCPGEREDGSAGDELEAPRPATQEAIEAILKDAKKMAEIRGRLSSISWFHKLLKEPISKLCNREDGCSGAFWEGRFKSTRLLDIFALILCTLYVDLNVTRAGKADSPETSEHTSAYQRIRAYQARSRRGVLGGIGGETSLQEELEAAAWLTPIDEEREAPDGLQAAQGRRASDLGFLPLTLEQYLQLLDHSGRQVRRDKRGSIPADLAPILERLDLDIDTWKAGIESFGRWFSDFAGRPETLKAHAVKTGQRWHRGSGRRQVSTTVSVTTA